MTERIAEIRERASKATEGPWECSWEPHHGNMEMYGYLRASGNPLATIYGDNAVWLPEGEDRSNGAFIAHARTDIPYLLAQLDAARAEVERLRAVVWDTLQTLQRVPVDLAVSGEVSRAIREHRLALKGFGDGLSAPTREEP